MKRLLNVINIDGTDGVGKTTQIGMMSIWLRNHDKKVLVLNLEDNIESALECTNKTLNFLEKYPDGIVLSDGSIARMMVIDMAKGMTKEKVQDKYKELLYYYEKINHKHGTANILMIMDDIEECHNRILKRGRLVNTQEQGINNFDLEKNTVQRMSIFDDSVLSKNLKFHLFKIESDESMIEIHNDLVEYLKENFDLNFI